MRADRTAPSTPAAVIAAMDGVAGVVFDKDGTLIDLDARWQPFFADVIEGVATRCDDPALVGVLRELLGVTGTGLVADGPAAVESGDEIGGRVVAEMVSRGHDAAAALEIVLQSADAAQYGTVVPIGDVGAALRSLAGDGLRLAVATSDGVANTADELDGLGLVDSFDPVRCADDGGPVKPDPAVLLDIAASWNVLPLDLVFVGDSKQDLETARGAGTRFVARCNADAIPAWAIDHADAVIADIGQLIGVDGRITMTEKT